MSRLTSSTANRGVEANEVEIANARLDLEASLSTRGTGAGDAVAAPGSLARTGSYLQVVVEKHKRRAPRAAAADDAPWPRGAVLLACPAYYVGGDGSDDMDGSDGDPGSEGAHGPSPVAAAEARGSGDAEPACVQVYQFARVGTCLASGAARPTRVGARAERAGRVARAAAAELGAAARAAAGAPVAAATLALRCGLAAVRDAATALLLAVSDLALKPALALTFNALLHPPLVFLANLMRGVRAALRPALALAGECLSPAAQLLRAARLVEVHHWPPPAACACRRDMRREHFSL